MSVTDVKKIKDDVKLIQNLLDEYLTYSKNESTIEKKDKIYILNILENIISQTKKQNKNRDIKIFCKTNFNIFVEKNNLIRVFSNLLNNACQFSDKIKVGKLDVDTNQASAAQQNVMSIPTLIIFKNGEVVAQHVGALNKSQLTEFIETNL